VLGALLIFATVAWLPTPPLEEPVMASPATLLHHPERYDGHRVRVVGTLGPVKHRRCRFAIVGRRMTVSALCETPPTCGEGTGIVVDGVFHRLVVVVGHRYYNHIVTTAVTCIEASEGVSERRG